MKAARRADLAVAQRLAAEGRHAEARALFGRHGIQYMSELESRLRVANLVYACLAGLDTPPNRPIR